MAWGICERTGEPTFARRSRPAHFQNNERPLGLIMFVIPESIDQAERSVATLTQSRRLDPPALFRLHRRITCRLIRLYGVFGGLAIAAAAVAAAAITIFRGDGRLFAFEFDATKNSRSLKFVRGSQSVSYQVNA